LGFRFNRCDLHEARKLAVDGVEDGAKIRLEASPGLEVMPRLSPYRMHHEISDF